MTIKEEVASLDHKYAECWAHYERRHVTIERIFEGRGIHRGTIRAKVIDETTIRYVNFLDIQPF